MGTVRLFKNLLLLCCLLAAQVPLQMARAQDATDQIILVFGDSLSASFGIAQDKGWVALLQTRLQKEQHGHKVINASISGETSLGGRNRLARALQVHRPSILLIELGGNDGLRGLPLSDMEHNLEAMIREAQAAGIKVLLAGMHLPPNYGPAYTRAFYDTYARLAKKHGTAYLPFLLDGVGNRMDLMQEDGIHPTAKAQARIMENVWNVLQPLLK